MDLIGKLWEQQYGLFLTRAEFEATLQGWDIEPVEQDGRVIGCFVVKGPELHFSKFDDAPVSRAHLERLQRVIREHGYALTRTPKDDARQLRFNARLGFVRVGEDEHDVLQRIDQFRVKDQTCPSSR